MSQYRICRSVNLETTYLSKIVEFQWHVAVSVCVNANKYTYVCIYVNVSQWRDADPYIPKCVSYYMQIVCVNRCKGEINKFLISKNKIKIHIFKKFIIK